VFPYESAVVLIRASLTVNHEAAERLLLGPWHPTVTDGDLLVPQLEGVVAWVDENI
jgi:hypothetical protein